MEVERSNGQTVKRSNDQTVAWSNSQFWPPKWRSNLIKTSNFKILFFGNCIANKVKLLFCSLFFSKLIAFGCTVFGIVFVLLLPIKFRCPQKLIISCTCRIDDLGLIFTLQVKFSRAPTQLKSKNIKLHDRNWI